MVFIAKPSLKPVKLLNVLAFSKNLSPSEKFLSPGPIINLTKPLVKNITPIETMRVITLLDFFLR